MPLLALDPPYQAAETVQSTFRAFAENGTFRSPALRNATGPLQLTEPHQIFTLGLADLVAGRGLEAAKPTGWRYLVQEGDKFIASAETVLTGTGDDHVFSAFNERRWTRRQVNRFLPPNCSRSLRPRPSRRQPSGSTTAQADEP